MAIITLTEKSIISANKISSIFEKSEVFILEKNRELAMNYDFNKKYYEKLSDIIEELFSKYETIIFIMATGIVIRHIAKYVESKFSDPAIIVCDERLNFAISLLSGHIGGANQICSYMEENLHMTPVITTATDVNKKSAIDTIAQNLDAINQKDKDSYKKINGMLANDETVYLISDIDLDKKIDLTGFTKINIEELKDDNKFLVHLTYKNTTGLENHPNYLKINPKIIALGIGCKKNIPIELMEEEVSNYLKNNNISANSIRLIGSIDIKKDEQAIIELAKNLKANFLVFSADEIKQSEFYKDIPKNDFVSGITGVNSVSLSVAKMLSQDNIIVQPYKGNGITIACGLIDINTI